jgi:putative tryptophan/tyrosine transport system substrate-binding protein
MDRRQFMGVISSSLLAVPCAAEAQQTGRVYTIGILSLGFQDSGPVWWEVFLGAMRELNYVQGRNLLVKFAFASDQPERLAGLAGDLVRAGVDVIVTTSVLETRAVRQATSTIPIVMTIVTDPVGAGLVASLGRPGGNVTGLTIIIPGLRQKYVELLREALPSASQIAVIASPPNLSPDSQLRRELDTAAKTFGLSLSYVPVRGPDDFEAALSGARRAGAAGIIAPLDPVTLRASGAFVQLALKHRLPGMYATREYVDVGGLMSYSANTVDLRRRAAVFVDKILKGAKPADLPVEQPTRFELVINLKTAKALGLTIPPSLLGRADEIIQ